MTEKTIVSKAAISDWLVDWISKELEMPKSEIEADRSLLDYSLSSVTATILVGDLEDWLDLHLPPTLVWDYPSINAIADHLVLQAQEQAPDSGDASGSPAAEIETSDVQEVLANLDELSEQEIDALLAQLDAKAG